MPYLSQEMKAELVEEIKKVLPKGWKASYRVRHYTSLEVIIRSAPIKLSSVYGDDSATYESTNEFKSFECYHDKEVGKVIERIYKAMNSQCYTVVEDGDYGSVPNYYVDLYFGTSEKAFKSTLEEKELKAA